MSTFEDMNAVQYIYSLGSCGVKSTDFTVSFLRVKLRWSLMSSYLSPPFKYMIFNMFTCMSMVAVLWAYWTHTRNLAQLLYIKQLNFWQKNLLGLQILCWFAWFKFIEETVNLLIETDCNKLESIVGAVVTALGSHQCGYGPILARCHIKVQFVVVSRLAPGIVNGTLCSECCSLVFLSPQKPAFPIPVRPG